MKNSNETDAFSARHFLLKDGDEEIPVSQTINFTHFLQEKGLPFQTTLLENSGHKLFSEKFFKEVVIPFWERNEVLKN